MADETVIIISVLIAVVVAILGLAITGFWIYLCCGRHRDLVWRRHQPEPEYPSRPLRVVVKEGGVVTIDTESIDAQEDEERDDIVSLQPSIAPISRKTNIRRPKRLFASQPNLNYGFTQSIGRMMESEPASHYQLSLDENDELLVDQGMFELNDLQEYDKEPQPIRASQVMDNYDQLMSTQSHQGNGTNEDGMKEIEKLDELFPSSPALSNGSSESGNIQKGTESNSMSSKSEVGAVLDHRKSSENGLQNGVKEEMERRGSGSIRSHHDSNGELKGSVVSTPRSKHSEVSSEQALEDQQDHNDGGSGADSDSVKTSTTHKEDGEGSEKHESETGSHTSNSTGTSSDSLNKPSSSTAKETEQYSSSPNKVVVRSVASMATKETVVPAPVTLGSSPVIPQHVPVIVVDTLEEEVDGLNEEDEDHEDVIGDEDTDQLIQHDNDEVGKVEGSPSSNHSPGLFRVKPSLIEDAQLSGSDSSLENEAHQGNGSVGGAGMEEDNVSNGSNSPKRVSPSSEARHHLEKKHSQTSVSSPLASVSHRAEVVSSSSAVSISDTESETDVITSVITSVQQPKQAKLVRTESGNEIIEEEEVEQVMAKQQPARKRKVTPAIQDPEKHMRQLMSMLSNSGGGSKSLGFIQEEGSGFIEEEEEEYEEDEEENGSGEGLTKF